MPRYTVGQISTYLREPESTIRAWFFGMPYGKKPHIRHFKPILKPAGRDLLSFYDAASAHVLLALKAKQVSTEDIRAIVQTLDNLYPNDPFPGFGLCAGPTPSSPCDAAISTAALRNQPAQACGARRA